MNLNMKRIIYLIFAAFTFAFLTGCQSESERVMSALVGEWHYSGTESGVTEDVWIAFSADGTFDMYQKVGDGVHWHTAGTYVYDASSNSLKGVYSDRYFWKYDYTISVGGSTLEMKAVQLPTYVVKYTRESIPAEVIEKSLELTKAAESFVPFL